MKKTSLYVMFFALLLIGSNIAQAQNIYTYAGVGRTAGYTGDGSYAVLANLRAPRGIAVGPTGNVYICDGGNHVIRMVNTAGVISTVAGNGTGGYAGDGGAATAAELRTPYGVAVDATGNLYIADGGANVVRMVSAAGVITTIAGTGTAGYTGDGAAAVAAELNKPYGIALGAGGIIYVSDGGNFVVRMISSTGTISTVAGDNTSGYTGDGGAATAAELGRPVGLAVDAAGNLYIADYLSNAVRKVSTAGIITTIAGTGTAGYAGDGGAATVAEINEPSGVVLDASGNLYIADYGNTRIRMVSTSGTITTYAGNGTRGFAGDGGLATLAELNSGFGVAINGSNQFYITDANNDVVRRVGTPVRSITISTATGDTVCAGSSVTFYATVYADLTPAYQWQVNGIDVGTGVSSYTYSPATGDNIVCMLDSGGVEVAISEALHVDTALTAGVVLGPSTLCVGSSIIIASSADTSRTAPPPPAGNWVITNGSLATVVPTPPGATLTGVAAGRDTVFYIVSNVCGADSGSLVINVTPAAFGAISGPSQLCAMDTATYTDPTAGGTWSLGGPAGPPGGNTINNATGLLTAGRRPGRVLVEYGTPGCTVVDTVTIVAAPRVAPISGPTAVYDGTMITMVDTATGGTWSCSDTSVAVIDATGDVTGITSGMVYITYSITNTAGCTGFALDSVFVLGDNAVKNVYNAAAYTLYPNPATGLVTLSWAGATTGTGSVMLTDVTGRAVRTSAVNFGTATGKTSIDVSMLGTGVYLVMVKSPGGSYNTKLTIE